MHGANLQIVIYLVWDGVEWIYLAQDRNNWLAVLNAVMKIDVV